jgi:RNA polymerase sigma-70 factor, ECF subfamily
VGETFGWHWRFIVAMPKPANYEASRMGVRTPAVQAMGQAAVVSAWDAYHAEVYAFLLDATRDRAVAEDLVQEAFTRLLGEARSGRMPEQPRPWLYRVAANLAVSRVRRVLSARRWFDRVGVPQLRSAQQIPSPEDALVRRETSGELAHMLDALRPDARTALLLAAEGFSGREIATAIGRSEDATRTLMCRARLQLRRQLETGGES